MVCVVRFWNVYLCHWKEHFLADEQEKSHFYGLHKEVIWRICLENMEKTGTWVENIFVLSTALFFGKDIMIVKPHYHYTISGTMGGQQSEDPPFVMAHLYENHFQSVLRITEEDLNNQNGNQQNHADQRWWHRICHLL